jgi:hypothetical protein
MDETEAYLTALTATPQFYDNLVRDGIKGDPQGGGIWFLDVSYRNIDPQHVLPTDGGPGGGGTTPAAGGPPTDSTELAASFAWDTTGATAHINQSFRTLSKQSATGHQTTDKTLAEAAAEGFMLDNQRAIGASGDGVQGADIYVPKFEWSKEIVRGSVDKAYMRTLRNMTGKVNNALFYQWPQGDVLYLGASGRQNNGRWSITHRFAVSETRIDVEIGNGIWFERVRGWEDIVVEYMPKPVNGRLLHVPKHAYLEQIYEERDFSLIGIGT